MKKPGISTLFFFVLLVLFLNISGPNACPLNSDCPTHPHSRPHPYVFWNQSDISAIKARVQDENPEQIWAKPIFDNILKKATDWLEKDVSVPEENAGWVQDFVCPEHGSNLIFNPDQPYEHECPKDGKIWTGEPYDSAWRAYRHDQLGKAARTLGLASLLIEDLKLKEDFAAKAAEILLDYAGKYPDYELHSRYKVSEVTGARTFAQTLDESVWLLTLVAAYDSIYSQEILDENQKLLIEQDLFCLAVKTIRRYDAFKSNWQAWHNTAIGAVGFLLEAPELIEKAINGVHGFEYHMAEGVQKDGFWFEGTVAYHFYTLSAYEQLALMAHRSDINLFENPKFRMMFDVPLGLLLPNLEFPRVNDVSSAHDYVSGRAAHYEIANTYWPDNKFDWLLGQVYAGRKRSKEYALLYGSPIESVESYPFPSLNLAESGLGILRAETEEEDPAYLLMDYGPHGFGHGHYDKLGLIFFQGEALLLDPGTVKYSLPQHEEWYTQTLAHNTLMMGEKSQLNGGESSRIIDYFGKVTDDLQVMQATVGSKVFPNGSASRTLLIVRNDYIVDFVSANGGQAPYDLVYHFEPESIDFSPEITFQNISPAIESNWESSTAGHQYLRPPTSLNGSSFQKIQQSDNNLSLNLTAFFNKKSQKLKIYGITSTQSTLLIANAPNNPFTEHHPVLIIRQENSSDTKPTSFTTLFETFSNSAQIHAVQQNGNEISINYGEELHTITLNQEKREYSLTIGTSP